MSNTVIGYHTTDTKVPSIIFKEITTKYQYINDYELLNIHQSIVTNLVYLQLFIQFVSYFLFNIQQPT